MFTSFQRLSAPFALAGLSSALLLSACNNGGGTAQNTEGSSPASTNAAGGGKRYKIGFANLTEDIPFAVRVREGIQKAAKDAGNVDLVTADNKLDGATASANADNFITQGVQGVIEFQTDEKFGKSIMEKFNAKKIPVIAIDIPMPGATFSGVNNPVAGQMAGKGLGEWIKKNWNGQVDALIMLELPQSGPIPAARMKASAMGWKASWARFPKPKSNISIAKTPSKKRANWFPTPSPLPNAKHIAIVCINDDTAAGAIAAAEAAGRKKDIAVVAVDASDRGREEIRKPGSPQIGSTASFPEKYGAKMMPVLLKALESGQKMPDKFYTDHVFSPKPTSTNTIPTTKNKAIFGGTRHATE